MTSDGKGVPLAEAVQHFSDPEDWERLLEASAAKARCGPVLGYLCEDLATPAELARARETRHAREDVMRANALLTAKFLNRLETGELIATGYQAGSDLMKKQRVRIPPDLLTALKLNYMKSSASGGGFEFVAIRVERAAGAPVQTLEHKGNQDERASSFPGRRSFMPMIEQEMRRRASEGMLAPSLAKESAALAEWAKHRFPGNQTPKARSIGNGLRATYRGLAARKPGTK